MTGSSQLFRWSLFTKSVAKVGVAVECYVTLTRLVLLNPFVWGPHDFGSTRIKSLDTRSINLLYFIITTLLHSQKKKKKKSFRFIE